MNEIITAANLFSFTSRSYWPISEGKKKSNQRIVLQRKRETWRKKRRETVRERDLWEEERPELVTMRVWGEKKQKEERKSEKAYHEREGTKKICFLRLRTKIIFIIDAMREREIIFQILFWKNNL